MKILILKAVTVLLFLHSIDSEGIGKNIPGDDLCPGYIRIEGSTNLHSFDLVYSFENKPVEFPLSSEDASTGNRQLMIPVDEFRGKSSGMEKDFHKLVRSDQNPLIIIEFKGFDNLHNEPEYVMADIRITMAGTSHSYRVPVEFRTNGAGVICLRGHKAVMISDFQLEPPVKFFGLIEVEDYINIDFSINFNSDLQTDLMLPK